MLSRPLERARSRRCDKRLVRALREIKGSTLQDLRRADHLEPIVGRAGLVHDRRDLYGADERYMNPVKRGLWQIPRQFSEFLIWTSDHRIRSVLDVGTYVGYTFAVMMTYLSRFNPDIVGTTVDRGDHGAVTGLVPEFFKATYERGTSDDYKDRSFDLCFIDGDHRYDRVARDYENVGRHAAICAFHDIVDEFVQAAPGHDGGVPRFWAEVKDKEDGNRVKEFRYHSQGRPIMGIGVIDHAGHLRNRPRIQICDA